MINYDVLGLLHVVDFAIGHDEQDVVDLLALGLVAHDAYHFVEDLGKVGGATQLDALEVFAIDVEDRFGTLDLRVGCVTVEGEAVVRFPLPHELGNPSEAPDRETFIVVVCLQDRADRYDGLLILVVSIKVVQGGGL